MSERLAILGGPPAVQRPAPRWPQVTEEMTEAVLAVLRRGKLSETADFDEILELEEMFKAAHATHYALAVASGTAARDAAMFAVEQYTKAFRKIATQPHMVP
jgi:dTDP-4-amino-4,6-dideoxygalactose transaminase